MKSLRLSRLLGLTCVACAMLTSQIVLTRVFSVVMWYHFAFLAISVALFGMGLGGMAVHIFAKRIAGREDSVLALAGALGGAANGLTILVLLTLKLGGFEFNIAGIAKLALVYLVAALPFVAGGVFISLMLRLGHRHAGIVYFFDLVGAGAGCLLTIPLLAVFGGPAAILVAGALVAIGGLIAAGSFKPLRFGIGIGVTVCLLTVAIVHLALGGTMLEPRYIKGAEEPEPLAVGWNSFSRVIAYDRPEQGDIMLLIDGVAHTPITPFAGDPAPSQDEMAYIQRLPYDLKSGASTLIFGSGGGEHILTALDAGARRIVGVEMNRIVLDWVNVKFADVAGGLFTWPGVEVVYDEGRSFIRRSNEKFDIIQFTLIDTWAATAAGAFVLTENNVFTVESMHEYFDHLAPNGMISAKRWLEARDYVLRLVVLARVVLEQRGVTDPSKHFFVARDGEFANVMIKLRPFSIAEVSDLVGLCEKYGLAVIYSPFSQDEDEQFTAAVTEPQLGAWLDRQEANLAPPTDNRPFFFYSLRLRQLPSVMSQAYSLKIRNVGPVVLYALFFLVLGFVALLILLPAYLVRDKSENPPRRTALYFALLGMGYLLVEVALMQKFILYLGHPVYALAVVLLTLLVSSGVGAALSEKFYPDRAQRRLPWVVGALALYAAVLLVISPRLFFETLHLAVAWRILITAVLLVPLGVLMGIPFPLGVRLVGFRFPRSIPWMFAVNSAASVLGSVLAMLLAVNLGFNAAVIVGLLLYLVAGFML